MCKWTMERIWVGPVTFRLPSVPPDFLAGTGFRDPDTGRDLAAGRGLLMEH